MSFDINAVPPFQATSQGEAEQAQELWGCVQEAAQDVLKSEGVRDALSSQSISLAPLLYIGMIRTLMATDEPNRISDAQEGMLTEAGLDPANPLQAVSLTSWVDGFMIGLRWERHVNEMTEGLSL